MCDESASKLLYPVFKSSKNVLAKLVSAVKANVKDKKICLFIINITINHLYQSKVAHANDLRIKSTEDAVARICAGHYQMLDLAKVDMVAGLPGNENGKLTRYSANLVTWGLGVDSTIKAEKMRWMGPMRYDVGILMAIMANNRRQATLTLDGHAIENDFTLFLIQNSQTGGSLLPLAPGASLDDGIMDIGILKKMKRGQILKAFSQLKKEGRHVFHPMVDYHRFKTLEISTPKPTAINVDGENIGSTPLKMEVMPSALKMIHSQ